jgi:hypothetical protein
LGDEGIVVVKRAHNPLYSNSYPQETQINPNWKRIWQTIPKYICWKLWLARNDQIFNNTLPFPPSIVVKAKYLLLEIVASYSFKNEKKFLLAEKKWIGTFTFRKRNQISFRPYLTPPWRLRDKDIVLQDWWRRQDIASVFFYEASKKNPGNAGAGRVIYFSDGSRKDSSSWGLGQRTNNQDEILGLLK